MAETVRQIPAKYSVPLHVFHPAISSYGRRAGAAAAPLLLVAAVVLVLWWVRPRGPVIAVLVLLAVLGGLTAYGYLRPALAAITPTHALSSRWIGFRAAARADVAQVVTVDALLTGDAGADPGTGRGARRGGAQLWLVSAAGRRMLSLDGRVWDATTLRRFARLSGAQHVHFQRATPAELARHWPRLVPWRLRHPRLRYALSSAALVGVLALSVWWSLAHPVPAP